MPPKTEEEIRRARLESRQAYLNQRETIKAAVNERLVTRTLDALGDSGTDVMITEEQLTLLEKRMEAKEIHDELQRATNASLDNGNGTLGGFSMHSSSVAAAGQKREREEVSTTTSSALFSAPPEVATEVDPARAAAKAVEEAELQRRLQEVGGAEKLLAAEKTEAQLEDERRQARMSGFEIIQAQRKSLPVYQHREEFLKTIDEYQVLVVEGETGSGKTTQLLQYMLEEEQRLKLGVTPSEPGQPIRRLICTQPRRLAATSVAERVAKEMGSTLGHTVGYKVRFDDKTSPEHTKMVFMTDGMMLKELTTDPTLNTACVVMVDEAHERSLSTDVLLGLLRDLVRGKSKNELRVILASATIQVEKFCQFFGASDMAVVRTTTGGTSAVAPNSYIPRMRIKGRTFPVKIMYQKKPVADYVLTAAEIAMKIHLEKPMGGDILIFLTGQDDIERCAGILNAVIADMESNVRPLLVTPVYASLPPKQQQEIHRATPEGYRKVVIATNIAETSITVNGIVYVIDCGLVKQNYFTGTIDELAVVPTSQASAGQRTGRAGRTRPGECYRLYTNFMFHNELPTETEPEIKRSSLASVVLQLKSIGIDNLLQFDFLDPPPRHHLEAAIKQLLLLGALDPRTGKLSELGKSMAEFPLEPCLSKCLVSAKKYRCANEMAIVAAVMTQEGSVFMQPMRKGGHGGGGGGGGTRGATLSEEDQKKAIAASRDRIYEGGSSDMFGYVMAFRVWMMNGCNEKWATEQWLSHKTLVKARDVYNQILGIYDRLGIDWKGGDNTATTAGGATASSSTSPLPTLTLPQLNEALTMCLCQGFFAQSAKVDMMDGKSFIVVGPKRSQGQGAAGAAVDTFAAIHPSSYLAMDYEAIKAQSQRLLTLNNSAAFGAGDGKNGAAAAAPPTKRLPPLVMFVQLRLTSADKPFMCHVATVNHPQWLFAAAPRGYFDEANLVQHVNTANEVSAKLMA